MESFIAKERSQLERIKARLSPLARQHLSSKIREVSNLIDLLAKSKLPFNKQQSITKMLDLQTDKLEQFGMNTEVGGEFHALVRQVAKTAARHGEADTISKWASIKAGSNENDLEPNELNREEQVRRGYGRSDPTPTQAKTQTRQESIRGLKAVKPTFLTKVEAKSIFKAPPEVRSSIVNGLKNESSQAADILDAHVSTNNIKYGLAGGEAANVVLNAVDPPDPKTRRNKIPAVPRGILGGSIAGSVSQYLAAGTEKLGLATGAGAVAGGVQALTYKGLKSAGASEFDAQEGAGAAGGSAGAAVLDAASSVGAGAVEGEEAGALLAPLTGGASIAAGAALGAALGGGAYELGKLFPGIKNII
jgi:hypothetical protein